MLLKALVIRASQITLSVAVPSARFSNFHEAQEERRSDDGCLFDFQDMIEVTCLFYLCEDDFIMGKGGALISVNYSLKMPV